MLESMLKKERIYYLWQHAIQPSTLLHVNIKELFPVKKMVVGNEEVEEGERRRFFETWLNSWSQSGAI